MIMPTGNMERWHTRALFNRDRLTVHGALEGGGEGGANRFS